MCRGIIDTYWVSISKPVKLLHDYILQFFPRAMLLSCILRCKVIYSNIKQCNHARPSSIYYFTSLYIALYCQFTDGHCFILCVRVELEDHVPKPFLIYHVVELFAPIKSDAVFFVVFPILRPATAAIAGCTGVRLQYTKKIRLQCSRDVLAQERCNNAACEQECFPRHFE